MTSPNFLTPAEVVERWDNAVTTGTLANWRTRGEGPPFTKFGARVRYPLPELKAWEAKNLHNDNAGQTGTKEEAA